MCIVFRYGAEGGIKRGHAGWPWRAGQRGVLRLGKKWEKSKALRAKSAGRTKGAEGA